MIDKNSLQAMALKTDMSFEYELTERWLETNIEAQMVELAKEGKTDYEFIVHVSEINPSMIRKVLSEKGYGILWWPEPFDAKPPFTRMKIKVLW